MTFSGPAATYPDVLAQLFVRTGAGIKLGLEPMRQLLDALGAPDRAGMQFVIVAGTNGKGSTSSQTAAALLRAGHSVGLYTSPHLLRFTERIRVGRDGGWRDISEAEVVEAFAALLVAERRCERPPTYFEAVTAMALRHFAAQAVEVVVLEVGLGGRLDATNVVDRALSVITPIGLDHMHMLGDTVEAIAAEKAGIIAAGRPVVLAPQEPKVSAVLTAKANALAAPARWASPPQRNGAALTLRAGDQTVCLDPAPGAAYQDLNLATAFTACCALDELGISCPPSAFAAAAKTHVWAGRYQWIAADVLVDAAHNPHGVAALLASLDVDPRLKGRPVHLVFSSLRDKPAAAMLAALRPRTTSVTLCPLELRRGMTGAELATLWPDLQVLPDVPAAMVAAKERAAADGGVVLVAGSIFLVADAIVHVTGVPRDPPVPY